MVIAEAIKKAVVERDSALAGRIADFLRIKKGMTYQQIQTVVQKVSGADARDWEALMYEADSGN